MLAFPSVSHRLPTVYKKPAFGIILFWILKIDCIFTFSPKYFTTCAVGERQGCRKSGQHKKNVSKHLHRHQHHHHQSSRMRLRSNPRGRCPNQAHRGHPYGCRIESKCIKTEKITHSRGRFVSRYFINLLVYISIGPLTYIASYFQHCTNNNICFFLSENRDEEDTVITWIQSPIPRSYGTCGCHTTRTK